MSMFSKIKMSFDQLFNNLYVKNFIFCCVVIIFAGIVFHISMPRDFTITIDGEVPISGSIDSHVDGNVNATIDGKVDADTTGHSISIESSLLEPIYIHGEQ